jgi:hypothetical protein
MIFTASGSSMLYSFGAMRTIGPNPSTLESNWLVLDKAYHISDAI